MSTVLRPVGPHEARVYWFRRAVLAAIIVILVVVLVEVFSGGSSKAPAASHHSSPSPSTTASSPAPVQSCDPSVLKLVLSTDHDTYTSGQSPQLTGRFSNPSSTACTLSTSASSETWTVKSGSDNIWASKGCVKNQAAKQLTLKAGGSKSVSILWNGRRNDPQCAVGAVALPGTYELTATLDGVAGKLAVFHVTS